MKGYKLPIVLVLTLIGQALLVINPAWHAAMCTASLNLGIF